MASDPDRTAEAPRQDRLDSWGQIAAYLGRGITTVQRWEQKEGLPIHRLPHAKQGSIFAFTGELDAWRAARAQSAKAREPERTTTPVDDMDRRVETRWELKRSWIFVTILTVVAVVAGGGAAVLLLRQRQAPVADVLTPKPLANDSEPERAPSLSPDGNHVVYDVVRNGLAQLYVKPTHGGAARPLLPNWDARIVDASYAKWSPDGSSIAFLAREVGANRRTMFIVPAQGGSPKRLTTLAGIGIAWRPETRTIGFVDRNSAGEPFSIFSLSVETGERHRLTTPAPGTFGDTLCAFSPDGRRVAVVRYSTRDASDLFVAEVQDDGNGRIERLTHDMEGIEGLDWTPDGRAIVFGTHRGLWKIDARAPATPMPLILANSEGGVRHLSFSRPKPGEPARLAYQAQILDVNIWRWDAGVPEGAALTRLPGSTWWENFPAFSPDGRRFAFASSRTGANEIWIANRDGSDQKQITFHRGPVVTSPRWSPDGRRLVFSSQLGGNRDIYVIDADGSNSTRLTSEPSQEENPSWSRDGRWIYFRSDRAGIEQIWKMPVDGGNARAVTTGQASQGFDSPDGQLLYFVRNVEIPGVWSIPVAGGKETLLIPHPREAFWDVADNGIYFLLADPKLSPGGPSIRVFSFTSHAVSTLTTLAPYPFDVMPGFSVARDGSAVLWTLTDTRQDDLMLIDPWR